MATIIVARQIVLTGPADWELWLSYIQMKAELTDVWELITPFCGAVPIFIDQPIEPEFYAPVTPEEFDPRLYKIAKLQHRAYERALAKYDRQQKAYIEIIDLIYGSISIAYAPTLQREASSPWGILKTLRKHFDPSDQEIIWEVEERYEKLCKGPADRDIEAWMAEWYFTVVRAKQLKIEEMTVTKRLILDFLLAIRTKYEDFADDYYEKLDPSLDLEAVLGHVRIFIHQGRIQRHG